jgi:hypothetical protein
LLLRQVDRWIGLTKSLAKRLPNKRDPGGLAPYSTHSALVTRLPAIKLQTNIAGFVIESMQLKLIIELSCRRADFCLKRVQLSLAQLNDRCLPGPILRLSKL